MNNLQIFKNESFGEVRTIITDNNEILFCAKDVASSLGYSNTNKAVNDHCKKSVLIWGNDSLGRQQEVKFIPESDVYRLIVRSKLPQAEQFENWIFEDVLPSIRKNGGYIINQENMTSEELLANAVLVAQRVIDEKQKQIECLQNINKQQTQMISELQPKASYYDIVLQCKDLISVTLIAKDYGKSASWLNNKLKELGVQYKHRETWLLYEKYAERGYTSSKTHTYTDSKGEKHTVFNTNWTQAGRLFIYDLLKQNGILPLIEQE